MKNLLAALTSVLILTNPCLADEPPVKRQYEQVFTGLALDCIHRE